MKRQSLGELNSAINNIYSQNLSSHEREGELNDSVSFFKRLLVWNEANQQRNSATFRINQISVHLKTSLNLTKNCGEVHAINESFSEDDNYATSHSHKNLPSAISISHDFIAYHEFYFIFIVFFPLFRFMNAVNSHLAENKRLRQELHGKDHRADIANDIGTHRASSKCVRLGEEVFRTHKKCICIRILNLYCARSFGSLPHQNLISV